MTGGGSFVPTWVLAFLALELMIVVHEVGHLLIAKRVGITVHTFAIGFGPRLLAATRGETTYALNLLPIGGYVNMAGEDTDTVAAHVPPERNFRAKSVGARLAVVLAGPAMNFLLAIVLLAVVAVAFGVPVRVSTQIGSLVPGYPAAQAGLRPGDVILAIDGQRMSDGQGIIKTIHASGGRTLSLLIQRGSAQILVHVPTRYDAGQRVWLTGFSPTVVTSRLDPARALGWGALTTGRYTVLYLSALGNLIQSGKLWKEVGGPVAAFTVLGQAAHAGWERFADLTAIFSIIIGLFNLFPLPALDGGRLAFLVVEGLRRRPVDPRREGYIHLVGLAVWLCIMLLLTVRDLLHPVRVPLP
jgi:regulator of sigma E protease